MGSGDEILVPCYSPVFQNVAGRRSRPVDSARPMIGLKSFLAVETGLSPKKPETLLYPLFWTVYKVLNIQYISMSIDTIQMTIPGIVKDPAWQGRDQALGLYNVKV